MGDLRLKAQEILKVRQHEKEYEEIEKVVPEENSIKEDKEKSKRIFTEKIKKEIRDFQKNLLDSANRGESLKIDILKLNGENLLSWWEDRDDTIDNNTIYRAYSPIKSGIVTFIDDINLELLTDDIIIDSTLQELYTIICENDIYPEWKIEKRDDTIESLYLEVNPLVSYREKKVEFKREVKVQERALVVVKQHNEIMLRESKEEHSRERVKNFILLFLTIFYLSVAIFTIFGSAIGISNLEQSSDTFSFIGIAWPYFLFSDFSNVGELFLFSLPFGFFVALYFAYKKS